MARAGFVSICVHLRSFAVNPICMYLLSEISPVDQWMIGFTGVMSLATLGALVVMIVALNKKQQVRVESPLDVRGVEHFVSTTEFQQHAAGVAREIHEIREILRREIPELERRIAQSGEQRVTKLHDRINDVLAEVARLAGRQGKG
jgi:hypothetical protein